MNICLATTWYPRGELPRFASMLSMLEESYTSIVIVLLPNEDQEAIDRLASAEFTSHPNLSVYRNDDRLRGRYIALQQALQTGTDFIQYADMDRLLRWVETQPAEWKRTLAEIPKSDCVVFGRTQAAYQTHPQALITTEKVSNWVASFFLKREVDISAGSKSFSRKAAQYVIEHCQPDNSIGADAEWPIALYKAGFSLEYITVAGLDWESADQFKPHAASRVDQVEAARLYDAEPQHWARRVEIADEIIRTAIKVSQKDYLPAYAEDISPTDFGFDAVFDVDDYLYFYGEVLTDERTEKEVNALVISLHLDQPRKILDLACGFGRHTNRLAAMGHQLTGVDCSAGFLQIARQDAQNKNVKVDYRQGDMRNITFDTEFDIAMLLFTAFGYFSDEENLQVLQSIHKALVPGGRLIFDMHNRDAYLKYMRPFYVVEKDGNLMIDRITFDSLTGMSYNRRIVFRDGIRKDKPFSIRYYNANEIKDLLAQAGLELDQIYGGWDLQQFTSESPRMLLLARKPV